MAINTTGIKITPNCELSNQLSVTKSVTKLVTPIPRSEEITTLETRISLAVSVKGCSFNVNATIDNAGDLMFGVTNVPDCSTNTTGVAFQPVRQFLPS
jgi:hypothetical protein